MSERKQDVCRCTAATSTTASPGSGSATATSSATPAGVGSATSASPTAGVAGLPCLRAQNGMESPRWSWDRRTARLLHPGPPILALVFGVIGRKKAAQGLATNGGMATAGMILGIVGIVAGIVYWIYSVFNAASSGTFST